MPLARTSCLATVGALLTTACSGQTLVGPEEDWIGIDGLEVTSSGGTATFDVRFDQRPFDEVFGPGTPDIPFTTEPDMQAALLAIGAFFDANALHPFDLAPVAPAPDYEGLVDNFYLPLVFDDNVIYDVADVDFSGPAGWRYNIFNGVNYDRTVDLPAAGEHDAVWVVFTPVPAAYPCETDGDAAQVNVFDLLAFLANWFAQDPAAECDGAVGLDVFDLLCFLECWFPASMGASCE